MSAQTKAGGPILSKPLERSEPGFNELPLTASAGATFPFASSTETRAFAFGNG
jgi:hypothetical protein